MQPSFKAKFCGGVTLFLMSTCCKEKPRGKNCLLFSNSSNVSVALFSTSSSPNNNNTNTNTSPPSTLPHHHPELSCITYGGMGLECSNKHYGVPMNLIKVSLGKDMGDGWETARHRERSAVVTKDPVVSQAH